MGPLFWLPTRGRGSEAASGSSYDPSAKAFFAAQSAAGQTLSSTQKNAINAFVIAGKAHGWWGALTALYPFLGLSAACDAINLVNPATFLITWNGTVTHSANGITGDGTTGYGDTGINALSNLSRTTTHQATYNRTVPGSAGPGFENGAFDGTTAVWDSFHGGSYDAVSGSLGGRINLDVSSPGCMIMSRTPSPDTSSLYINGSLLSSNTAANAALPNLNIFVCGANFSGVPTLNNTNIAIYAAGTGVSAVQAAAYYADIQTFQTALSRQV
jgi:hypothetical protein